MCLHRAAKNFYANLEQRLEELESGYRTAAASPRSYKRKSSALQEELQEALANLEGIKSQLDTKEEELARVKSEKTDLLLELDSLREQLSDVRARAGGLSLQLGSTEEVDLVRKVTKLQGAVQEMIKHPDASGSEELSRIMVELDGAKARGEKNQAAIAEKEATLMDVSTHHRQLEEKVALLQVSYEDALSKLKESDQEKGRLSRRVTELEALQAAVPVQVTIPPSGAGGGSPVVHSKPSEREAALLAEVDRLRAEVAELQKTTDQLYEEIDVRPTGCAPFLFGSKQKKRRPTRTPGGLAPK